MIRILFALALAMVMFHAYAFASPIGAKAVYVAGEAMLIPANETKETKINAGTSFSEGDRIKTTFTGVVEIEFDNGDLIRVDRNAEMVIKTLHRDEQGASFSIFQLLKGRIKSSVSNLATGDSKFEYHTKAAIVGTDGASPFVVDFYGHMVSVDFLGRHGDKGSIYVQGFDSAKTMASLFAGAHPFTALSSPPSLVPVAPEKRLVSLAAGSRTFVVMGAAPGSPAQISPERIDELNKTMPFTSRLGGQKPESKEPPMASEKKVETLIKEATPKPGLPDTSTTPGKKPLAGQRDAEPEFKPVVLSASSNYGSWTAGREGNDGNQLAGFFQLGYDARTWGLAITGKSVQSSYQSNSREDKFSVSTITDTELSDFVAFTTGAWTLRTGVDVTLPTGKHGYTNNELRSIMSDTVSSDLMAITSYGQGLNFSPHLVVANKLSPSMTVGLGLKYSFTGEYDATSEINNDNMNPGDRLTALMNVAFMLSPADYILATGAYSTAGRDTRQGVDIFRQGDIFSLDFKYIHKWFDGLTSVFNVNYMTQQKNELINESLVIENENQNSNNNSIQVAVNNAWTFSKKLAFTGMVGYKQVDANSYAIDNPLYDGGRWKAFLEPGVMVYFSESLYASFKGRYTRLLNKKDALASEDIEYNVYNLDLAVVYNFGL